MVTFGLGIKFGITALYPKIAFNFLCRHNTICIVVQNKHSEELKRLFYLCTTLTNSTFRTNPTPRQDYKKRALPNRKSERTKPVIVNLVSYLVDKSRKY